MFFIQSKKKRMYDFVFLINPRNLFDVYGRYPFARYIPDIVVRAVLLVVPPFVVGTVSGLKRDDGTIVNGLIMTIPMLADQILKFRELAKEKILRAVKLSEQHGVRVLGLGSLTSPAVNGGADLIGKTKISITNGNSLTAGMTIEGLFKSVSLLNIEPRNSIITIVGATGSIGSAVSVMIAKSGIFKSLILIGKTKEHLIALRTMILETTNMGNIEVSTDINIIKNADIVIVATSSSGAIISNNQPKFGALIYDITQPQNVHKSIRQERLDVTVVDGAILETPYSVKCSIDLGIPPNTAYACLSETMILAADNFDRDYTIGKVEIGKVDDIMKRAKRYDFKLAPLRSFGELI